MDKGPLSPEQINTLLTTLTPIPEMPGQRTGIQPTITPVPKLPTVELGAPSPRAVPPVVVPTAPPVALPTIPAVTQQIIPAIPGQPTMLPTIPRVQVLHRGPTLERRGVVGPIHFDGDAEGYIITQPPVQPTLPPITGRTGLIRGPVARGLARRALEQPTTVDRTPHRADFDGDEETIYIPTITQPPAQTIRTLLPPITITVPPPQPTLVPLPPLPPITVAVPPPQPTLVPLPPLPPITVTQPAVPPQPRTIYQPTIVRQPITITPRVVPIRPTLPPLTLPIQQQLTLPVITGTRVVLRTVPSPPTAEQPIRFMGDLPPITIDPLAERNLFLQELRDTFHTGDKEDPTMRWIRLRDRPPLGYDTMRNTHEGSGLINAMERKPEELSRAISILFGDFKGTKDEIISLYWWGIIYPNFGMIRSSMDIQQIHELTDVELKSVVPANWNYPRDRASIIFKLLTGYNPPRADATKEPRYKSIIATDPKVIMRLAQYVYNYFGRSDGNMYDFYSHYSPYRHVALQEPSIMEPFILQYNKNRIDQLANAMGMRIPFNIMSIKDKEMYYFDNLKNYQVILSRDPNRLVPVPDLENIPRREIPRLLEMYTDAELIDGYEMLDRYRTVYRYISRKDLIDRITNTRSRTNNRWQFRKHNCINADRVNIYELDPREDTGEDPMISYGTMKNYRCWNRDELEGLWVEHDGMINFNVPDWRQGDPYQSFPIASIRQLRHFINGTGDPVFDPLVANIDAGIRLMANADVRVRGFRAHYEALIPDQQRMVREYLVWMFSTSMYMRFWLGPGNPYPSVWREGGGGDERCDIRQRTENVQNQFLARITLLERMPTELEQWVLSFPRIEYNFNEGTSAVGAETINFIVEEAQRGKFCIAEGSDHLIQTSYYLITQILNTDLAGFNRTINEFLGGVAQPDFNPREVTRTRHVDPQHRLRRIE